MDKTLFSIGSIIQFEGKIGKIMYVDRIYKEANQLRIAVTCSDMKSRRSQDDFYCSWPDFDVLQC